MNPFQDVLDRQKRHFATGVTRMYMWRVEQLEAHVHYYGKYSFDMLTHAKSMFISPPDVAIEHLFPPYTPEKNAELKTWFEN